MRTYCLALDLKHDPALIEEYKRHHRSDVIWPEAWPQAKPGEKWVLMQKIFEA